MTKKSKRSEGTPRLIRRLFDLLDYQRRGLPTTGLQGSITQLFKDRDEVTRAFLWLGTFDRLASLAAFQGQSLLALVTEAQRADLTKPEALALLKAFQEVDDRMEAAAKEGIERKWQEQLHPGRRL